MDAALAAFSPSHVRNLPTPSLSLRECSLEQRKLLIYPPMNERTAPSSGHSLTIRLALLEISDQ